MAKRSRYRRKQARIKAERAEAFRDCFFPWPDIAPPYRLEVQGAMLRHPSAVRAYRQSRERPARVPAVDDLALTLRAAVELGQSKRGLSLYRLREAFRLAGLAWSRAKGSACLRSLVDLNLTRQTSGHSAGNRGRQFAKVVHKNPNPFPDWFPD